MKTKRILLVGIAFISITRGLTALRNDDKSFEISKQLNIYATLFRDVNMFYVDEVNPGDLVTTGIKAMLKSLDPYTVYYPESEMEDVKLMTTGEYAGQKDVIISNTGYTGAGGFELYFYPEAGEAIWNAIFDAGAPEGIKPIGVGARDTLRLERGFCLYGNDLSDTTSPLEAGLGWITKFVEGKDFTARAILEKQKAEGLNRKLVGFEMIDRGIPRHGYELVNAEGEKVGEVTSGTMSPIRKIGIGMGYIQTAYATPGTEVFIDVRGRKLKAMVVKPPFRK